MKNKKLIIGIGIVLLLIVAIVGFKACGKKASQVTVETAKVKKGTVSNTVTATGTVQAIKTVSVGCQVSGVIDKLYVDYNSHVTAGQLLAEIDKRTLTTSLENAGASLDNAKAEMTLQTANYNRTKALHDKSLVAQTDFDQALYDYTKAQASLKTAQLEYDKAKINLGYASIYSPIDGVVLSRAVDEGQTVAASFSTPTLFSIAKDLTQMQVEANIDEADIGKVKEGQRVSFKVDAFSNMNFNGQVVQIRLNPTTTNNVVTYTVIVKAPNPDLRLMPGLTADITIYVEEAKDVLTVSSKALHFTPDQIVMSQYMMQVMKDAKEANPPAAMKTSKNPTPSAEGVSEIAPLDSTKPTVWVKEGPIIHPVNVSIGIDDDLNAQILSGLKEGEEVVTSMKAATAGFATSTSSGGSPFMPKPPSNNSSRSTAKK
jgi:HlyD family secretion protein